MRGDEEDVERLEDGCLVGLVVCSGAFFDDRPVSVCHYTVSIASLLYVWTISTFLYFS